MWNPPMVVAAAFQMSGFVRSLFVVIRDAP